MRDAVKRGLLGLAVWLAGGSLAVAAGGSGAARPMEKPSAGADAAESAALIKGAQDGPRPDQACAAALGLADVGLDLPAEAVGPLLDALRHDKAEIVRAAAAEAFWSHNESPPSPVLIEALHATSPRVRVRAALAINAPAKAPGDETPCWFTEPLLVQAALDDDPVVRGLVALAVDEKSADAKAALPVLLASLEQEDAAGASARFPRTRLKWAALRCLAISARTPAQPSAPFLSGWRRGSHMEETISEATPRGA